MSKVGTLYPIALGAEKLSLSSIPLRSGSDGGFAGWHLGLLGGVSVLGDDTEGALLGRFREKVRLA
ncbi:MAG: hypothetical protein AAF709_16480 [Pseudomonadota bacterium]